uniref:uncharacterized protein LOC104266326 n=1 Tax=Ciona intestinalis TaxID=7719 RepID=UPI00089DA950|nr:uncharacterized protein LOC104266326 [Ciona intestinalis]|eukprot:XP_009860513.2 uncharacterized protein LOC104266326 [Ciona intestinalis]
MEMKDSLMESLLLHLDAMERLHFQYVGNLTVYMKRLSNAINQRSNKIQLELVQQKLCGRDVIYLAGCLGNISRLEMSHTVILKEHCSVLKQAIQQLPSIQDFELVGRGGGFGSGSLELVEWFEEFKRQTKEKPGIMPKVVGSSHEASTSSDDDTSHPSISEPQPTISSQDVSIPAPTQFESSSKCWIGSIGGKLEVGGCELVVPPGALEEDVEIKLTASLPLESEYLETPTLHCEPASLTFNKQVTIKLQTHVVLDKETVRRCTVGMFIFELPEHIRRRGIVVSAPASNPEVMDSRLVVLPLWAYVSLGKTLNDNCFNPVVTNELSKLSAIHTYIKNEKIHKKK